MALRIGAVSSDARLLTLGLELAFFSLLSSPCCCDVSPAPLGCVLGVGLFPSVCQVLAGFFQSVLIQETFLCVFDDSSILFPFLKLWL